MMTDPIADLFTRIRNGQMVRHPRVDIPGSKMKSRIVEILKDEGYIGHFTVRESDGKPVLDISLKYYAGRPVIEKIERVAKDLLEKNYLIKEMNTPLLPCKML